MLKYNRGLIAVWVSWLRMTDLCYTFQKFLWIMPHIMKGGVRCTVAHASLFLFHLNVCCTTCKICIFMLGLFGVIGFHHSKGNVFLCFVQCRLVGSAVHFPGCWGGNTKGPAVKVRFAADVEVHTKFAADMEVRAKPIKRDQWAPIKMMSERAWSPGIYQALRLLGKTLVVVVWERVFIHPLTFN